MAGVFAIHVRITIDTYLVTELTAEQLIQRHAIRLASQIPQCDLNAGYPAALPGRAAELLELTEDTIHIAGVFAEKAALEHQRIGLARSITYLSKSGNTLIGIDTQDRAALRRAINIHEPQIGDLQLCRVGTGIKAHVFTSHKNNGRPIFIKI